MDFLFEYHQDPHKLHISCEDPRAYFIPFQSKEVALTDEREQSEYFLSLCGEWDF